MKKLLDAIREGETDLVKNKLNKNSYLINGKKDDGQTPLHHAAFCGKDNIVSLLISFGADVNIRDNKGYTPLHEATHSENSESVKILLSRGADVNAKAEGGYEVTPLSILAQREIYNSRDGVNNSIIDKLANILIEVGAKFHSISVASVFGEISDIEELINKGVDIDDALHPSGWTALHIAAIHANIELAEFLINRGANINPIDEDSKTPLEYASTEELYLYLRKNGAETSEEIWDIIYSGMESANQIKFGYISGERLLQATKSGDLDSIKKIMSLSVHEGGLLLLRLISKDSQGNSPLHIAATKGFKAIVCYLLEQGIADYKNNEGKTAKDLAEKKGFIDIVNILIENNIRRNNKSLLQKSFWG